MELREQAGDCQGATLKTIITFRQLVLIGVLVFSGGLLVRDRFLIVVGVTASLGFLQAGIVWDRRPSVKRFALVLLFLAELLFALLVVIYLKAPEQVTPAAVCAVSAWSVAFALLVWRFGAARRKARASRLRE